VESTTKVTVRPKYGKNIRNCQDQTLDYDVAGDAMDLWNIWILGSSIMMLRDGIEKGIMREMVLVEKIMERKMISTTLTVGHWQKSRLSRHHCLW